MNMIKPLLSNKELYTMTYPQKWVFLSICDTFHIPPLQIVLVFYLLNSMNLKTKCPEIFRFTSLAKKNYFVFYLYLSCTVHMHV